MNGDFEKAMDGMKYASIPFANFMAGEGGLLTSLMQRVNSAVKYRKFDSSAVKYEFTRTINKLIPGQAVLGALKSIFDPTLREGVGADLPVVSEFLPEKIDPTTGKPIEPRQEFPPGSGIEIPQFGNVPIPGAKIIQDPVSNILGLYGMLDYTMPRRPIAGIPVSDIPREFQRRYMELAARARRCRSASE